MISSGVASSPGTSGVSPESTVSPNNLANKSAIERFITLSPNLKSPIGFVTNLDVVKGIVSAFTLTALASSSEISAVVEYSLKSAFGNSILLIASCTYCSEAKPSILGISDFLA